METQKPFATILGCSDSRVPPELIFDVGFGELFTIRVAGNVIADPVDQARPEQTRSESGQGDIDQFRGGSKCPMVLASTRHATRSGAGYAGRTRVNL